MTISSNVLVALMLATSLLGACSSDGAEKTARSEWTCQDVRVPLGKTRECTAAVQSALLIDPGPVVDGPAYYCPPGTPDSDCPPPNAESCSGPNDNPEVCRLLANAPAGSGGAGGTTGGTTTGGTPTSGGAGGGGAAPGSTSADQGTSATTTPGTGGTTAGTGAHGGEFPNPGTGAGTQSDFGTAATSGWYCTKEDGQRTCRKEPECEAGAHRDQMDCEPDQSSGLGVGARPVATGGFPGAGSDQALPGAKMECFYPVGAGAKETTPAATFEYILETVAGAQELHVRLTFSPHFVDNSYGTTSIGWAKQHQFKELVGSDHSELTFFDKAAVEKLHFKLDYISKSTSAPSGYACLGVSGGEGRMILGDASTITKTMSSLDRNLNERGYKTYIVDSPASDDNYTPPAAAPTWDFRVVYEAWIKNAAFGASGFGNVKLAFVHASPSKANSNTLPVESGPCPPDWTPPVR